MIQDLWIGVVGGILSAAAVALLVRWNRRLIVPMRGSRHRRNLAVRMTRAGLSNFYASRADYGRYRNAARLSDYLAFARNRVLISAYWMAQGAEMEGVVDEIELLVRGPNKISFDIAIVDPTADYVDALARHLNVEREYLVSRVQGTLSSLWALRAKLAPDERQRFRVLVHRTVPMASLIALDPDSDSGRVQIDIKPYRAARQDSVSFEFAGKGSKVYDLLRLSTERLISDAVEFDPTVHRVTAASLDAAAEPRGVARPER
ncbi:hypothetical protein FHX81_5239 [Saccharothrix saharensis]|uniref:Uncharacterized protein n=1 Tax=Saccharothrix saharensis TaxID=571190 RepID=A0A543JJB4_9PSEU|nr:hypothetical protein [Saccharothrix saharensis]TQM82828.1 hypothetical protein FHX81_5239 [Saccharothrix saharensis]